MAGRDGRIQVKSRRTKAMGGAETVGKGIVRHGAVETGAADRADGEAR